MAVLYIILHVLGRLTAVESLTLNPQPQDSAITLTWTPPFTLDIRGIKPDISGYCVDVFTASSSARLHSECEITDTKFSYPMPPRNWCDLIIFTITPVNVVGNGTRNTVSYMANVTGNHK